MKDYRLSEIQARCKIGDCVNCEFFSDCDGNKFGDVDKWDIEPRDMIELPCKEHRINDYGKDRWDVYYRDETYGFIRREIFGSEAEADAFLAELKQ